LLSTLAPRLCQIDFKPSVPRQQFPSFRFGLSRTRGVVIVAIDAVPQRCGVSKRRFGAALHVAYPPSWGDGSGAGYSDAVNRPLMRPRPTLIPASGT